MTQLLLQQCPLTQNCFHNHVFLDIMTVSPLDPLWLGAMSPFNLVTGCLLDKSLISHLALLIPLAKPHLLLVLCLTIWWLLSFFSAWLMARQDCVHWHLVYLLCWRYWFLVKCNSHVVFLTNHWSPIWHHWFLQHISPTSCPPIDNLVVALYVSVWLMAREDYVYIDILNSCILSFSIALNKPSFINSNSK